MPPKAFSVRSTSLSRSAGTVRSPRTASAPIRSASRSSRSRRRANMATFAPSSASASAIARPMPDEAPQTIAVLPSRPRFKPVRSTPTTSRTASADSASADCSSSVSSSSTISSTPPDAELDGNAHVQAVDAVLALEQRRARQDALLVEQDRVDHLRHGRAGRVPGRRSEQVHDLAAALPRALDHRLDALGGDELRRAGRRRRWSPRRRAPSGRRGRRGRRPGCPWPTRRSPRR